MSEANDRYVAQADHFEWKPKRRGKKPSKAAHVGDDYHSDDEKRKNGDEEE